MYHSSGIPIPRTHLDPKGSPSPDLEQTIITSFILDATDFTSLDPQKIVDEYQRMQNAADATGTEGSDADTHLKSAHTLILANWHGSAALAFAEQMINIGKFMEQQQERLVYAMQAMGTAFGLAVQFRQSYHELAESTIEACRAVIAKRPAEPTVNGTMIAIGSELVNLGVSAIGTKSPKDLMKVGIEWFNQQFENATKDPAPIDSGDAPRVLNSYLTARDRLRGSFDDGLRQLGSWLDAQRSAYFTLPVPMLQPLPAYADVHSPDFSYERFSSDHRDPTGYAPKVEQERKRYAEENPHPDGPIRRRLKGEE